MAQIAMQHIYKQYEGGIEAVRDFNLEINDREFFIFVGPSGCGKSTMLRMIAGIEDITQGILSIDGKRMNEVESCNRDIAMVFQNYALYPHMTVFDNIAYSMKLRKRPKSEIRDKVHEAARILDIEAILNRRPKELSGGQKQRVAMGRAIVRNPKIFLMDEPLSNLDAKLRTQMRAEILKLYHNLQSTFIYVTHDQTEAMTLGTRIGVMKDGVIQQVDTPERLYDYPCNKFVAGFIGTPLMNFMEAKCCRYGEKIYIKLGEQLGELPHDKGQRLLKNGYVGKNVIIGIRPEDVYDAEQEVKDKNCMVLCQEVRVYEMLGPEAYLYFEYEGLLLTARVEADTRARQGDMVLFGLDMSKIHVFDRDTENAI